MQRKRIPLLLMIIAAGLLTALVGNCRALSAETYAEKWSQANEAYRAEEYERAAAIYEDLLREGASNARTYYNLGNAYSHMKMPGMAAWMYENALAQKPRMQDARHNLALVRSHIANNENDEAFFLFKPFIWLAARLTAGEWSAILWLFSSLTGLCAVFWILSKPGMMQFIAKAGFFVGAFFMVISLLFFLPQLYQTEFQRYGVVVEPDTIVRSGPGQQHEAYYETSESEKYLIQSESQIAGWLRVKHPQTGRAGYLPEESIHLITRDPDVIKKALAE